MLTVRAQKAEEVLEKYFTAIGGIENCRKIQSIRVEGYYQKKHQKTPFIIQGIHMTGERIEIDQKGKKIIVIITPTASWTKGLLKGDTMHRDSEKEFRTKADDLDLQSEFIDYQSKGASVQYLGKYEEGNKQYYKLKLITKHTRKVYYFDQQTNLIYKVEAPSIVDGIETNSVTKWLDYREIAGVKMPFKFDYQCDQGCAMTIVCEKEEINAAVDASAFNVK